MLTRRLRDLEAAGILARKAGAGGGHVYALTPSGKALEPALLALVRWGLAYGPENRKGYYHRDDWDLLALKALFQPQRAGDLSVCVQFRAEEFLGWMAIDRQRVSMGLGDAADADIIVDGSIKDLFAGTGSPDRLCAGGSKEKLARFMSAFVMPA